MQDKSHELPLRWHPLIRMRGLHACTGISRKLFPYTALPGGNRNSMTLSSISNSLYMKRTNPCAPFTSLNFTSIKNPHLFRGDCIIFPDTLNRFAYGLIASLPSNPLHPAIVS